MSQNLFKVTGGCRWVVGGENPRVCAWPTQKDTRVASKLRCHGTTVIESVSRVRTSARMYCDGSCDMVYEKIVATNFI